MADDLPGFLKGARDKVVGAVKTGADVLNQVTGGAPAPAPMLGRLPLGEIPKSMPVINTPTSKIIKKAF